MDSATIGIVFLGVLLALAGPLLGIYLLTLTRRRRNVEFRLSMLSKQQSTNSQDRLISIPSPPKKVLSKPRASSNQSSLGKTVYWLVLLLPPLWMLLVIDSFYSSLFAMIIYMLLISGLHYFFVTARINKFKRKFVADLPNSIDLLVRSLKAGRTLTDAMRTVGEETKTLVAIQFKTMSDQLALGKDFMDVVDDVSRALNIAEFSFFVLVLSVQQETGGNIIKTLGSLADMLRQRQLMRLKVRALASEGIFSAFFMGGLPFIVAGMIFAIRPEYMSLMFSDPLGKHLLMAGAISETIGCIMIGRMVKIKM